MIDATPPETNGRGRCHIFLVTAWTGEPAMRGDEHVRIEWFTPDAAAALGALALPEYRELFALAAGPV